MTAPPSSWSAAERILTAVRAQPPSTTPRRPHPRPDGPVRPREALDTAPAPPREAEARTGRAPTTGDPVTYRVLITGSRAWRGHGIIHAALDEIHAEHPDMVLISGACAQGADAIAERWAALRGADVERHPAQWNRYGRGAGFRRNAEMVALGADVCVAFIRAGSSGATHTADLAENAGIKTRRWTA